MKWFVFAIAVLMYALVIAFQDKKVLWSLGAAAVAIALGTIFPGQIFSGSARSFALSHSFAQLINWNVLMIYIGSMIIAALFIYSKAPQRIAELLIQASPSAGIAMVLILAMTGIISIFVENVATVLVMAPIAIAFCQKLNLRPVNFMLGLAVMSNLEGTATLVGDPPSMIFASFAGYGFNDFFIYNSRPSIFFFIQTGLLVGCVFFYFIFRAANDKPALGKTKVISLFPSALLLLMILGLALMSFFNIKLAFANGGYVLALGIIGLIWRRVSQKKSSAEIMQLVKGLDWETIFFLIGVFVIVGALSESGLLLDFANFLGDVTGGSKALAFVLILIVSIIISGFIDNVPYIIVMLPVAASLSQEISIEPELFMFALLIGSCLGGNLTPYGASANVVAMGIVKKQGYPINFATWLKLGAPFTLLTTGAAAGFLWLVWG